MPTARIITRFPDRAGSLRKTLVHAGYRVEIVPPEKAGKGYADLEYDLDSMPEFAAQTASAPDPIRAPIQHESKTAHDPTRRPSLRPRIHALTESFAGQRQQLERRLSSIGNAALERKRAWEAEAAKRAQEREQKRAEEQLRREQELAAKRETERIAAERARERAAIALREKQEREAQRRAETEAAAQRRAAELAARREAERITAEKAAIARREQREREAERQRLLNAEMERRRREREEELARGRAAAELRAQISAEEHAQQAEHVTAAQPADNSVIAPPQRRRSLQDRWDDLTFRVYERIREWRELLPNSEFGNTRDYAWRQAVPAAAGLAIAFVLGWGLALSSTRNETTVQASPAQATMPAAVPTGVTPMPVAAPIRPLRAKPSPSVRKSSPKVSRRHPREIEPKEDDVIIVRHAPKRQLIARASQKNGVKTISDLE